MENRNKCTIQHYTFTYIICVLTTEYSIHNKMKHDIDFINLLSCSANFFRTFYQHLHTSICRGNLLEHGFILPTVWFFIKAKLY